MIARASTVLIVALLGCKPESAPLAAASPEPAAPNAPVHGATAAPVHGATPAETAASQHPTGSVSGVVKEVVPAGRYTYLRLERQVGGAVVEEWAAVLQAEVAVGSTITVQSPFEKRDFESPTLKRRFDRIWFGTLEAAKGSPKATERPAALVPPPPGGLAIADLHSRAESLAGQTVTVRGMVTKFNEAILDRNWLHVSDGSGEGRDDLTVTTDGKANVGDTITVTGTVAVKQDFGFGYQYDLLLEKATLAP